MKDNANKAEMLHEMLRDKKSSLDSPELEFWQPSDERAELLVLLGGKGWTLICRRGGAIQEHPRASLHYLHLTAVALLRLIIHAIHCRALLTYLHQAVKDPLLAIEKQ